MLYVFVVGPHKPDAWPAITPGLFAKACTNNFLGMIEGLWPHAFEAATMISPPWNVGPKFTEMAVVPCPFAMVAPAGTVHT